MLPCNKTSEKQQSERKIDKLLETRKNFKTEATTKKHETHRLTMYCKFCSVT